MKVLEHFLKVINIVCVVNQLNTQTTFIHYDLNAEEVDVDNEHT